MMPDELMGDIELRRWSLRLLLGAIFVAFVFAYWDGQAQASTYRRPQYSLANPHAGFIFENYESLPFHIIRPICWNSSDGFGCDKGFASEDVPRQIWIVTDWRNDEQGEIYRIGKDCFWWMYAPEKGDDGQPHVREHFWISCPPSQ